jgi:ABC-type nitrate/sulfonate/bicarbonate transport system permease component
VTADGPATARGPLNRLSVRSLWRSSSWLSRWLVLACGGWLWQLWASHRQSPFFPPPSTIFSSMHAQWFSGPASHLFLTSDAVSNILPSLGRILLSLAIIVAIGVPLGIALGRSSVLTEYLDPLLQFARSIPVVAAAPVFIALFKIGTQMEVATIVFGTIWPLLLNTIDGARTVDPVQVETARAFRYSTWERLRWLIIPAALPKIFTGLRLALSLSLILMVFSELVGSTSGIGYEMSEANNSFNLPELWSTIVLLGILGYLMNGILYLVEKRVLAWHRNARQTPA